VLGDWDAEYEEVWVSSGREEAEGTVTLVLVERGGQRHVVRVDAPTGDTLEWRTSTPGAPFPAVTRFEDFRLVSGVRVPFRQIEVDLLMGETVFQFEAAETARVVDAALFRGDG
jgi:hypothetical protein